MVPRSQNPYLFRLLEGTQTEAPRLEQRELFSCMHYILQASYSRSLRIQAEEVVLYGP